MKAIFLSLILLFVTGSAIPAKAQTTQQIKIVVKKQKTIIKDNLTIKFVSLVEDSRCPTDTNCIWAGNAKIKIQVGKGKGAAKTFELNTNLEPQTVSFAGYEIKFVNLTPQPATNIRINRNGYTATFAVSKTGK